MIYTVEVASEEPPIAILCVDIVILVSFWLATTIHIRISSSLFHVHLVIIKTNIKRSFCINCKNILYLNRTLQPLPASCSIGAAIHFAIRKYPMPCINRILDSISTVFIVFYEFLFRKSEIPYLRTTRDELVVRTGDPCVPFQLCLFEQ